VYGFGLIEKRSSVCVGGTRDRRDELCAIAAIANGLKVEGRFVVEICEAMQEQQRRARADVQQSCGRLVGGNGLGCDLRPPERYSELALDEREHVNMVEVGAKENGERLGSQRAGVEREGHATD